MTPDPPPFCVLAPEQTEGPFFLDTGLLRRDITEGKPGASLRFVLQVVEEDGCVPIRDAVVEVWHTDASGAYSGFSRAQGNVADTVGSIHAACAATRAANTLRSLPAQSARFLQDLSSCQVQKVKNVLALLCPHILAVG